jgi:hypothetical protein
MIKDLLSRTDLAAWPSAALVGFVIAFAALVAVALFGGRGGRRDAGLDATARLPLDDGERPAIPRPEPRRDLA